MEQFSVHKPTHLELSVAWWTFANMYPTFTVSSFLNSDKYTELKAYRAHWYQLFIAAYKGEI